MFLLFLFSFCFSAVKTASVVPMIGSRFKKLILNRPKNQVWIVLFAGNNCPACKSFAPKFNKAADMAGGMIKFGLIDINHDPDIAQSFGITAIPHIRIFYADGDVEYTGTREAKALLNTAVNYLQDFSLNVEESWLSNFLEYPSAILFTEDKKTKSIWCGISSFYQGKSIRIGVCRNETLFEKFNISDTPAVYFYNGTNTEQFTGKVGFKEIRQAIDTFFSKKLENKVFDPLSVMLPEQFKDECIGGKTNCILSVSSGTSTEFLNLQKLYSHHKMKWFAGKQNLPFSFMEKKGGFWIYNPRRNGFIFVDSVEQLHVEIDHVLDGQGKWKKAEFFENNEL